MEAIVNDSSVLRQWHLKLADVFPVFRRSELEQDLAEAETRISWQKKHTDRIRQRYDTLNRQCVAMSDEIDGLRSRLYVAEQQAKAFKEMAKTICTSVETAEDLKWLYGVAASYLDDGGFNLFDAAQEITGFCLSREFPYEDACGCFEFLNGTELLRYLIASEFGAVDWETIPSINCKKAVLREVDESTPAYREFERQLYKRALERLGLRSAASSAQARQD